LRLADRPFAGRLGGLSFDKIPKQLDGIGAERTGDVNAALATLIFGDKRLGTSGFLANAC
jgi:hypothetical protein